MGCKQCGQPIEQPARGRRREFCARQCAVQFHSEQRARKGESRCVCAHCGGAFLRKRSHAQFCSDRCRVAERRSGGIPEELRAIPRWVLWGEGGRPKAPRRVDGRAASSTNPATWSDHAAAAAAVKDRGCGVGFVFAAEDDLFGVDLDECVDPESGEVAPWAQRVVDALASSTELSPSGRGLHIYCRGNLAKGFRIGPVEVYPAGRYFTVTGRRIRGGPVARIPAAEKRLRALAASAV